MLSALLYSLRDHVSVLRVFHYTTVRTGAAGLTALAIGLFQIRQVDRQDTPASHKAKAGTPTMGGLLILSSVFIPTLLWADLTNAYIWIALGSTAAFGAVGFVDDYLKISGHSHRGLSEGYKLASQTAIALAVGLALLVLANHEPHLYNTRLIVPFFRGFIPDLGIGYVLFSTIVLVFSSNAVNLTDGLDGLAISIFAVSAGVFTVLAFVNGNRVLADYLLLVRFPQTGELTIFCGALASASCGGTRIPRTCSWATWGRSRWAARSARWRSCSNRNCCCRSSVACLSSKGSP